jgi:FkbM family methyltransferase
MSLPVRAVRAVRQRLRTRAFGGSLKVSPRDDLVGMGLPYGRWTIPASLLGPGSACYLAGIGKDISFDLGLIARFGCTVHAFDPVPEAIDYARAAAAAEPRFVLHPAGLWSKDGALRFYDHREPGFVSHSATDMHGTGTYFEAPVRSVASLMAELGHDHVDLLKLSVEGSEYELVGNVLDERLDVRVLCVEFAQPAPRGPIDAALARLRAAGYELVEASLPPYNWKLTFVHPAR